MRTKRSARTYSRCSGVVFVAMAFLWPQSATNLPAQSAKAPANKVPPLDIIVLAGEGGVNVIKAKKTAMPVVEVRDKDRHLVAGLSVTFTAPSSGPRVTFAHGSSFYSTVTDANGRATVSDMRPLGEGSFKISVTASYQGQTATAAIAQTNYLTVAAASSGAGSTTGTAVSTAKGGGTTAAHGISKTLIVVIVAGVAAGAGAAAALGKGGGSSNNSSNNSSSSGTIGGAGPPSIGPPH